MKSRICNKCKTSKPIQFFTKRGYICSNCKELKNKELSERNSKICSICGIEKLIIDFTLKHSECKECRNKKELSINRSKGMRPVNITQLTSLYSECSVCRIIKLHSESYRFKYGRLGLMSHCKSCDKELVRQYKQNNYEVLIANARVYNFNRRIELLNIRFHYLEMECIL